MGTKKAKKKAKRNTRGDGRITTVLGATAKGRLSELTGTPGATLGRLVLRAHAELRDALDDLTERGTTRAEVDRMRGPPMLFGELAADSPMMTVLIALADGSPMATRWVAALPSGVTSVTTEE